MLSQLLNRLKGSCRSQPPPPAADVPDRVSTAWKPGDVIMERFRVEKVMSGSMGNVYISDHLGWGIKIAIKSPRPEVLADREGLQRILKEADHWIRVGMHPNVAACYYVLSLELIPHLFIEYVDGGSLADWLRSGKCRDLRTALSLAIQFCHGMEYTHSHGIIHRDIKPANILISKNALLKITDFGILLQASEQELSREGLAESRTGDENATIGFRGTPGFAAPEQFSNTHGVDKRADIFSFGLCLWLMLCGRKPFKKNAVRSPVPEPVPLDPEKTFPDILVKVLKKTVAHEPAERYQDFAAVRTDLNAAYQGVFGVACPYAVLHHADLRADGLNNRAVSYHELGKIQQAEACLKKALEINDVLPEAIHNLILMNWRSGRIKPPRILRKLQTARKRLGQVPILEELEIQVKDHLEKKTAANSIPYPEFRLCIPRDSLAIFREGQLNHSVERSMLDHLQNKRYPACQQVLQTSWRHQNFRKERVFTKVYEQLLCFGEPQAIEGGQRLFTLEGKHRPAGSLAHIPFSRKIVVGGPHGVLEIWDFTSRKRLSILNNKQTPLHCLAVSPNGKQIAAGTEDGSVTIWSAHSGQQQWSRTQHQGPVRAISYDESGRHLVTGGDDGLLALVHLPTGRNTSFAQQSGGRVQTLLFGNKGKGLVAGSDDGCLRYWETGQEEYTRIIEAHALPVVALAAAPDGRRFASAGADRLVKIWEHHSGRCLKIIEAHEEAITSVLMLADNRHLVSGCEDDIIKVWDCETGKNVLTLDGRGDGINSLARGPKPHIFLAGRQDGAIVFWMLIYQLAFE